MYKLPNSDKKIVSAVELQSGKVFSHIKGDNLSKFRKMLFIYNYKNPSNESLICFIMQEKVEIFEINKNKNTITLKSKCSISLKNSKDISKFEYLPHFMTLFLIKKYSLCVDLINFGKENSNYKLHSISIEENESTKEIQKELQKEKESDLIQEKISQEKRKSKSIFNFIFSSKSTEKKYSESNNDNNSQFSKSQIYIQEIYSNLYLIILNFLSKFISIYELYNSEQFQFKAKISLPIDNDSEETKGSLQFIDNLILFHNFSNRSTFIYSIDIQKEDIILKPILNFPIPISFEQNYTLDYSDIYETANLEISGNYFIFHNEEILNYSNEIEKGNINKINKKKNWAFSIEYFYLYFDSLKFINIHPNEDDALFDIIGRKEGKNVLFNKFMEKVANKQDIISVRSLFYKLSQGYYTYKLLKENMQYISDKEDSLGILNFSIMNKEDVNFLINQKEVINKIILSNSNQKNFKTNFDYVYCFNIFLLYKEALDYHNIQILSNIQNILLDLITHIKNQENIFFLLETSLISKNIDLANYILYKSNHEKGYNIALNILFRLGKIFDIFKFLLYKDKLKEALILYLNNKLQFNYEAITAFLTSWVKNKIKNISEKTGNNKKNFINEILKLEQVIYLFNDI